MKSRVLSTSHTPLYLDNLKILARLFISSGYPSKLVNKILFNRNISNNRQNNNNNPNTRLSIGSNVTSVQNSTSFFSLPNIDGVSERIKNLFSEFEGVKITFKNTLTIRNLHSRLKDKEILLNHSGVVYAIPCENCDRKYIGQTNRGLRDKITSHKSDIRLNKQSCSLATHALTQNHNINFNQTKITDYETHNKKRLFLEVCHIFNQPNSINNRADIMGLNNILAYLLHLYFTNHNNNDF